jgi:uncharacterized protein
MSITVYKESQVVSQPRLARTQWEKARGLMFSKFHDVLFHFPEEERLKFHMVFVFYPIDIVFMGNDMRVVDLKERFKPFSFYYSKACSSTVLETYNGFIKDHQISIGDQLAITHDGEIPVRGERHEPQSRMLHTTSLGAPRRAKTVPVSSAPTSAKQPARKKLTKKPAAKKTAPKPSRASAKTKQGTKKTTRRSTKKQDAKTHKTPSKTSSTKKPAKTRKTSKPKAQKGRSRATKR